MKRVDLNFLSMRDFTLALDETSKMISLKSKYIINFKGHFEINSCLYIVMEYADGGDLEKVIKTQQEQEGRQYLSERQIYSYMVDICEALCYCHAGGIIHRDLTPRNILIHQGRLKLSDFGISK